VVLWTMGSAERLASRFRGGGGDDWRAGPRRVAENVEYLPPGRPRRDPRVVIWRF